MKISTVILWIFDIIVEALATILVFLGLIEGWMWWGLTCLLMLLIFGGKAISIQKGDIKLEVKANEPNTTIAKTA